MKTAKKHTNNTVQVSNQMNGVHANEPACR